MGNLIRIDREATRYDAPNPIAGRHDKGAAVRRVNEQEARDLRLYPEPEDPLLAPPDERAFRVSLLWLAVIVIAIGVAARIAPKFLPAVPVQEVANGR